MYRQVRVEYYAPYLLKEGIVQKVIRYGDSHDEPILHSKKKVSIIYKSNMTTMTTEWCMRGVEGKPLPHEHFQEVNPLVA